MPDVYVEPLPKTRAEHEAIDHYLLEFAHGESVDNVEHRMEGAAIYAAQLDNTRLPADQRRGETADQRRRVGVPHRCWASRNASRSPVRLVPTSAPQRTATWGDDRPRLGSRRPRKLCRGPSVRNGPIAAPILAAALAGTVICA